MTAAVRRHPVLAFYLLTFAFSTTCLLLAYRVLAGSLLLAWIGSFAPAIFAMVITGLTSGRAGLTDLLRRVFHWRVGFRWYLVVVLLPLISILGTVLLYNLIGDHSAGPQSASLAPLLNALPGYLPLLLGTMLLMIAGILGEELGWRGFALPQLQNRWGALTASIIVGFFWGIWHIPAAMDPNNVLNRAPLPYSATIFTIGTIIFSLVYTWVYNHTSGSLLLMCLYHGIYDTLNYFASLFYPFVITQFWLYCITLLLLMLPVLLTRRIGTRLVNSQSRVAHISMNE